MINAKTVKQLNCFSMFVLLNKNDSFHIFNSEEFDWVDHNLDQIFLHQVGKPKDVTNDVLVLFQDVDIDYEIDLENWMIIRSTVFFSNTIA